jgi:hypothetical protein
MKSTKTRARSTAGRLAVLALVAAAMLVAPGAARASYTDSGNDMVVFGGQHQVIKEGQEIAGDLVVISGSADVYGKVDGDAVALGGRIYIAPQGHVDGSLVNVGGVIDNQSNTPQGHGGNALPPVPPMPTMEPMQPPQPEMPEETSGSRHGWGVFFLIDAVLAFLAFLLFPARTRSATEHLLENPVLSGMLGFFSPIILACVVVALAITVIGIPLIPLAVLLTVAGYLIGKAAIAEFLGERLVRTTKGTPATPAVSVAVGLVIFLVLSAFTGWVGIVIYFTLAAIALGASLYMLMRTAQAYRRSHTTPTPPAPAPPTFTPPADPTHTGPPAVQ